MEISLNSNKNQMQKALKALVYIFSFQDLS